MEMTHYNKIRYLRAEKAPAGSLINEEIFITADFKTKAEDFLAPNIVVVADETLRDINLPDCFPTDRNLRNTST